MTVAEGFAGQRMIVVPRPVAAEALRLPVTKRLLVTDIGYYPRACGHEVVRSRGIDQAIVIVCVSGAGRVETRTGSWGVGPGQLLAIPRGVEHTYGADDDDPWTIWWIHVDGTDATDLIEQLAPAPGRPLPGVGDLVGTVAVLDEIAAHLDQDVSRARLLAASGCAWKLLALRAADLLLPTPGDPLQRAMSYVRDRFDGRIRVPELAALVGVSSSHLTALFRRATGGGVRAHQTSLRMARARQLLDTTEENVGEIARRIGYADPFYFSRQFRRTHGVSPTAYRARDAGGWAHRRPG
ncbi:AraC family transcriptional regulator [Leifsonia aquatica]|uniref:AraC family transcriptional regulator n=1 Tax=Leifsonia aquatica TaxID=144185 RepID=UPI0004688AF7|nr:AraC family transcriptional regulator [Leifsonia aquatica]